MIKIHRMIISIVKYLDSHELPTEYALTKRIMKCAEETGEVSAQWLKMVNGVKPPYDFNHHQEEQKLLSELADAAIAPMVAIASLGHDPLFEVERKLQVMMDRYQISIPKGDDE